MVGDLLQARVVFVGETHSNLHHHQAQLEIIHALRVAGADVAVGLEMFRVDSQQALDRWVAGEIGFGPFMEVYRDNWGMWNQYSAIFKYAREKNLPLIGLNLSRKIISKVAREGFDSLSEEQLQQLPVVRCVVDQAYKKFIRRSLGKHDLQGSGFENFCEAQLLWDQVMAGNLHEYLVAQPNKTVIVLAGSGHSWKYGIPAQLRKKGESRWRVILPETLGQAGKDMLTASDADYLLQGVAEGPFH